MHMTLLKTLRATLAVSIAVIALGSTPAFAAKLQNQNLKGLVADAQSIISGQVVDLTDGFDAHGRPYTEVTIAVGSVAKGRIAEDSSYTFRQFGLLAPRSMGDGRVYLGVSPDGFPRWAKGETVMAFLYQPASITGFQTTVGLAQGKFNVSSGKIVNGFGNLGLFEDMEDDLGSEFDGLLSSTGAVDSTAFTMLVAKLAETEGVNP